MYSEMISDFIDKHKEEMKDKLVRLMEIPSVKSEAKPGMPYGENVYKAFKELLYIADGMEFNTDNFENRIACVTADDKEKNLGILCHLDVVEAGGSGWSAHPFRPTVKENMIYGRGAYDNKGPAIAALYALYAVRELGIPLNFGAALYFGTDEECGSSDFEEYLKKHTLPKYVFVPDSHFPVCNEERGIIHMSADVKVKPKKVVSAHAGSQINIIPDEAKVCFENIDSDDIDGILSSMKGIRYEIREDGQSTLVKIHGKSTHASRPDTGVNAVTAMLKLLGHVEKGTFEMLADLFRFDTFYGEGFCFEEGRLTLSLTSLDYENGNLTIKADSRVVYDSAGAAERIAEIIPMNVNIIRLDEPHNVAEDSYIVKTLSDIHKEHTGKNEKPYSMAGLTYAHDIEGAVVFGSVFPGDGSGNAHGADERFNLDSMAEAAKIFAKAIVRICNEE